MGGPRRSAYIGGITRVTLLLRTPTGQMYSQDLALGPEYAFDAATVQMMLSYCLVHATYPRLIDALGEVWRIRRRRLRGIVIWERQ
jgi:hypothetical protein